jgi:hypothetical protein
MPFLRLAFLLATTSIALLTLPATAQEYSKERWDPGHGEACFFNLSKFKLHDAHVVMARWDALLTTAEASGNEWAGRYGILGAETSYEQIRWAPRAGFAVVFVSTCSMTVIDLSHGRVEWTPSRLRLVPERSLTGGAGAQFPTRLVPVRWGAWRCLAPEDDLEAFCDFAAGRNVGGRYGASHPAIYVKSAGGERGAGLPILPTEYRRFEKPLLRATIASVAAPYLRRSPYNDENELVTPVAVDAGAAEGVKAGMIFRVVAPELEETVEITRVGKHSARGVIVRQAPRPPEEEPLEDEEEMPAARDDADEAPVNYPEIASGWEISTVEPYTDDDPYEP